jgi:hypothetical protein
MKPTNIFHLGRIKESFSVFAGKENTCIFQSGIPAVGWIWTMIARSYDYPEREDLGGMLKFE